MASRYWRSAAALCISIKTCHDSCTTPQGKTCIVLHNLDLLNTMTVFLSCHVETFSLNKHYNQDHLARLALILFATVDILTSNCAYSLFYPYEYQGNKKQQPTKHLL